MCGQEHADNPDVDPENSVVREARNFRQAEPETDIPPHRAIQAYRYGKDLIPVAGADVRLHGLQPQGVVLGRACRPAFANVARGGADRWTASSLAWSASALSCLAACRRRTCRATSSWAAPRRCLPPRYATTANGSSDGLADCCVAPF